MDTQEQQFLLNQQRKSFPSIGGGGSGSIIDGIIALPIFAGVVYILYNFSPYYWFSMEWIAKLFGQNLYFLPIPLFILVSSIALFWFVVLELRTNKEWSRFRRYAFRSSRILVGLSLLPAVLFSGFQTFIILIFYNPFF